MCMVAKGIVLLETCTGYSRDSTIGSSKSPSTPVKASAHQYTLLLFSGENTTSNMICSVAQHSTNEVSEISISLYIEKLMTLDLSRDHNLQ